MEIWRDIKNYEGLYQASNLGNIKSLKRLVKISKTKEKYKEIQECILKPYVTKQGYLYITLANNGTYKNTRIHRIIAETFIPNNDKDLQVNHINGNKKDNRVDNLEWVTCKENINKAWEMGLCENVRKQCKERFSKKVNLGG